MHCLRDEPEAYLFGGRLGERPLPLGDGIVPLRTGLGLGADVDEAAVARFQFNRL